MYSTWISSEFVEKEWESRLEQLSSCDPLLDRFYYFVSFRYCSLYMKRFIVGFRPSPKSIILFFLPREWFSLDCLRDWFISLKCWSMSHTFWSLVTCFMKSLKVSGILFYVLLLIPFIFYLVPRCTGLLLHSDSSLFDSLFFLSFANRRSLIITDRPRDSNIFVPFTLTSGVKSTSLIDDPDVAKLFF